MARYNGSLSCISLFSMLLSGINSGEIQKDDGRLMYDLLYIFNA